MDEKLYKVREVARVSGVTVRTLHHYDGIGLLVPTGRTPAGYRLYSGEDLLRLQQILICRELGLPLEKIKRMLDDPAFDREAALREQRVLLAKRREGTARMIRAIDSALDTLRGGKGMNAESLFDGFDPATHEDESRRRWGHTGAYRESARRTKDYTKEDWATIRRESDSLMKRLAWAMAQGRDPGDEEVLDLAEEHRLHIDRWYYPCSRAMHSGLAGMYVTDERFKAAFEKHGQGLAAFVAEAIRANAALAS